MSLARESQLPCHITPHFLDEKIESIIFSPSIYNESAIGRPTGLLIASRTCSHDPALMSIQVIDANFEPFPNSRCVCNLVTIRGPGRVIVIGRTKRDSSYLGLVTFFRIHNINLWGSGS